MRKTGFIHWFNAVVATFTLVAGAGAISVRAESAVRDLWKAPRRAARKVNPFEATPEIVAEGQQLFTTTCVPCHGARGMGDGPAAKDLERRPADLTSERVQLQKDGEIFWKITNGRSPMPTFGDAFDEETIWKIVNYVRTLRASTPLRSAGNPN